MLTRAIVIGTDGTDPGTSAVRWAAAEAERRRLPLRVVHVLDWDWSSTRYDHGGADFERARRLAFTVAEDAALLARDVAPGVDVDVQVYIGHTVARLLELSQTAELLVLGNRSRAELSGLLLGSVSRRLTMHSHCPVVVVRGRAELTGPVVMGVDDSEATDSVLETGFNAAAARHTGLTVVRSHLPALALPLGRIPMAAIETPEQDAAERDRLTEQLAPWRAKYPDVPVGMLLSHDRAAAVLVEASHDAQLAVIGSHGHSMLTGAVLGSTGLQLLQHAHCPVLVVRHG